MASISTVPRPPQSIRPSNLTFTSIVNMIVKNNTTFVTLKFHFVQREGLSKSGRLLQEPQLHKTRSTPRAGAALKLITAMVSSIYDHRHCASLAEYCLHQVLTLPEGATAFAGGIFFGYLLAGSLRRPAGARMRWIMILLFAAFGFVIGSLGFIPYTWIDFGLLLLLGLGNGYAAILLITWIQTRTPGKCWGG